MKTVVLALIAFVSVSSAVHAGNAGGAQVYACLDPVTKRLGPCFYDLTKQQFEEACYNPETKRYEPCVSDESANENQ
jgi:hypothetical protein